MKLKNDFKENPIDSNLLPVLPFRITNKIQLIILGQDPTVKNEKSRQSIEYTLNLDKAGSLKAYINQICNLLGISFDNIYATNVFKYFYTYPPERTMHVLYSHLPANLELLKEELAAYPNIPIIALGLPVLQLLAGEKAQVRDYWSYNPKTRKCEGKFTFCPAKDNKLERDIYPLPHQPSIRKDFYRSNLMNYIKYLKNNAF
ncbi:MAG TPA: hypothetical protein PK605_05250 [Ignavibacteria bacterium]|nr:hypothetical protein [Ignavibacteria bacterium]HRJ03790.1 hypothetical protein [Ignavibacteria bacterium]